MTSFLLSDVTASCVRRSAHHFMSSCLVSSTKRLMSFTCTKICFFGMSVTCYRSVQNWRSCHFDLAGRKMIDPSPPSVSLPSFRSRTVVLWSQLRNQNSAATATSQSAPPSLPVCLCFRGSSILVARCMYCGVRMP